MPPAVIFGLVSLLGVRKHPPFPVDRRGKWFGWGCLRHPFMAQHLRYRHLQARSNRASSRGPVSDGSKRIQRAANIPLPRVPRIAPSEEQGVAPTSFKAVVVVRICDSPYSTR